MVRAMRGGLLLLVATVSGSCAEQPPRTQLGDTRSAGAALATPEAPAGAAPVPAPQATHPAPDELGVATQALLDSEGVGSWQNLSEETLGKYHALLGGASKGAQTPPKVAPGLAATDKVRRGLYSAAIAEQPEMSPEDREKLKHELLDGSAP